MDVTKKWVNFKTYHRDMVVSPPGSSHQDADGSNNTSQILKNP